MSWSPAGGGLTSSRWNAPLNQAQQPLRQVQDVAPRYTNNNKSNIPPHLRSVSHNTENDPEQHVQTPKGKPSAIVPPQLPNLSDDTQNIEQSDQIPGAKPATMPPHMRGFSSMASTSPSPFIAPHLQVKPAPSNVSQETVTPVKIAPSTDKVTPPHLQGRSAPLNVSQQDVIPSKNSFHMDIGTLNQTRQSSQNGLQTTATSSAIIQKVSLKPAVQPLSGTKLGDDAFLLFLNKKVTADSEAKKKVVAEKAHIYAEQSNPIQHSTAENSWSAPHEAQPSTANPTRSQFRPNSNTDQAFRSFLHEQMKGPITNGKNYTFTGDQGASKLSGKAVTPQNMPTSTINASKSPFGAVNAHAAFSPSERAARANAHFMSNDAAVDALVQPGFEPQDPNEGFYDKVSNSGVEEKVKENVRASQGQDPKKEFLDWDGKTWRPPPCDWDNERGAFDNGFMSQYIRQDWAPSVPSGFNVGVDTKDPKFELAVWVGEKGFEAPIEHPMTIPDLQNSENQEKQRHQTADIAVKIHVRKVAKQMKATQVKAKAIEMQDRELAERVLAAEKEESPYRPKIDVYLRPATYADMKGITYIYNHYVENSLVTEDQLPITEDNIKHMFDSARQDNFPFIVAIKGKMPAPSQERYSRSKVATLPQNEIVIGFGYAEAWAWGLNYSRQGRSRFTACLQFYVHHEYTRKKVGQSLLDKLTQCLSYGYGARGGYDWLNPAEDRVYQPGGVQRFHQAIIQYGIQHKNDPNLQWMSDWLSRYFFFETGKLEGVVRTSPGGAKFADIVFFQKQVAPALEFGAQL